MLCALKELIARFEGRHLEEENSPPSIPDYLRMKEELDEYKAVNQIPKRKPHTGEIGFKLISKTGSTIECFDDCWYWFTGPLAGEPVDAPFLEAKVWRVL